MSKALIDTFGASLWLESSTPAVLIDQNDRIISANKKLARYYKTLPENLKGSRFSNLFPENIVPSSLQKLLENKTQVSFRESILVKFESEEKKRQLRFTITNVSTDESSFLIEVSNKDHYDRLASKQKVLGTILSKISKPVIEITGDLKIVRYNDALVSLIRDNKLPVAIDEISLAKLFEERELMRIRNGLEVLKADNGSEISFHGKFPSEHALYLKAQIFSLATKPSNTYMLVITDLTSDTLNQKWIEYLAYFDNLTGLPNLFWLEETVPQLIRQHKDDGKIFGLALFDINGFNQINSSLGHKIGDRALASMAARLRKEMHQGSMAARWSGDKFVIIFPQQSSEDEILQSCEKIMDASSSPIAIESMELNFNFNIGLSVYPNDGSTIEELFNSANKAMTYGKGQIRNHLQLFSKMPTQEKSKNELPIRNTLKEAIREEKVVPYYQPKIDAKTRKLYGFESLARWKKNDIFISPEKFIQIAEKTGMINQLGEQILKKSLYFAHQLKKDNIHINAAVNVSLRQLYSGKFLDDINKLSDELDFPRNQITLEITENISLYDISDTLQRLHKLKDAGYIISIDDFGTGYSSLSQLNDMPVQELKIDYSFIKNVHDLQGEKIVQAILMLANTFQLRTVAEGVEDQATADKLTEMGVDILQGFYFSPALKDDEFIEYARR